MNHTPLKPDASREEVISRGEVVSRTAFYLLGSIIQRAAQLLLLPFLMAALSPGEFTRFGLMISAVMVLAPLFSMNIHLAPGRLYFDYDQPNDQSDLLFSCISSSLGLCVLGLVILIGILQISGIPEPVSFGRLDIQLWVALILLLTVLWEFGTITMRIRGRARFFAAASAVHSFGILAAFLALGLVLQDGFQRSVVAVALGLAAGGTVAMVNVFRLVRRGNLQRIMWGKSLAYSAPTVMHFLALWVVGNSGRWIGTIYMELDDLAAYTLVTLIIMAMTMISRALFQALLPEISRPFASRDYRRGTRIINYAMVGSIIMLIAVYVGSYVVLFVFNLPLPDKYSPTPLLLIIAGTANLCDALFMRGAWILTRLKKTGVMAVATTLSAAATIAMSFALVRTLGDLGLVLAVAGGFAIQAVVSNVVAWWQLRIAIASNVT